MTKITDQLPTHSRYMFLPSLTKGYKRVVAQNILLVEADGGHTKVHTVQNEVYHVTTNLGNFIKQIEQYELIRVSRKHLINPNHICTLTQKYILLTGQRQVAIGKSYQKELFEKLPIIRTKPKNKTP